MHEVQNYDNKEFIDILNAFPDASIILINGSTDFEIRHSWGDGEPYINIVAKEKTVRAATRNGQR